MLLENALGKTVRQQLGRFMFLSIAGLGLLFGLAWYVVEKVKVNGVIYQRMVEGKDLLADILPPPAYLLEIHDGALLLLADSDAQRNAAVIKSAQEAAKVFGERHLFWNKILKGTTLSAQEDQSYETGGAFIALFKKKFLPLVQAGNRDGARELFINELQPAFESHFKAVATLVTATAQNNDAINAEANAAELSGKQQLGATGAMLCAAVVLAGWLMSRRIANTLCALTVELKACSEQVSAAASQVSDSGQTLAASSSEQASSLEETSASLEEMSSMTRQNADNARQANAMAEGVAQSAEKGHTAMERMTKAIQSIKSSSDETAKIVKTIDEIAFQTNLLALNAAVEAARAGESGKGFAVVAEEVRTLAQRSAEAARTTAILIEESKKNAENGVRVSCEVGEILIQVGVSVKKLKQLNSEVAAASNEQSKGVEQINIAVGEMDKVTQTTAAGAEESASAGEELSAQAEEMQILVVRMTELAGMSTGGPSVAQRAYVVPKLLRPVPAKNTPSRSKLAQANGNGYGLENGNGVNRVGKLLAKQHGHSAAEKVIPLNDEDMSDF